MNQGILSRLIKTVGTLLAVSSVVFVSFLAVREWPRITAWNATTPDVLVMLALVIAYGMMQFMLAESWHRILRAFSNIAFSRRISVKAYAVTQLAKYVPGNIFHLVGRHAWLTGYGFGQRVLVMAAIGESVIMISAAMIVTLVFMTVYPPSVTVFDDRFRYWPILVATGLVVAVVLASLLPVARELLWRFLPRPRFTTSALAVTALFFTGQALVFSTLVMLVSDQWHPEVISYAAMGWVIGYVTPGAPAGVGTREVVLYALTRSAIGDAGALLAIALFRLLTLGGDLCFFGLGLLIAAPGGTKPAEPSG